MRFRTWLAGLGVAGAICGGAVLDAAATGGDDPREPWSLACPAALVVGGGLEISGNNRPDIAWGRVIAKEDIELYGISFSITSGKLSTGYLNADAMKFRGAGIIHPDLGLEQWVRWQAGGVLRTSDGNQLFPTLINGVSVTDLFTQTMAGAFSAEWNLELQGGYWQSSVSAGEGILYDAPVDDVYTIGSGALVQNLSSVHAEVDSVLNSLNYSYWKERAILTNGYIRPLSSSYFVDAEGNQLYVNPNGALTTSSAFWASPLTNLRQLSMDNALYETPGQSYRLGDRLLFVDTMQGREDGVKAVIEIGYDFFWKGLLYLNADLDVRGGGGKPDILGQNPNDYAADPGGLQGTYSSLISDCFLDGLLYVNGEIYWSPAASVYGAVVSTEDITYWRPQIYYNSRLQRGLFQRSAAPSTSVQSGSWYNPAVWENGQVPFSDSDVNIQSGHEVTAPYQILNLSSLLNKGTLILPGGPDPLNPARMSVTGGMFSNLGTLEMQGASRLELEKYPMFHNSGTIIQDHESRIVFSGGDYNVGVATALSSGEIDNVEVTSCTLVCPPATDETSASLAASTPFRVGRQLILNAAGCTGAAVSYEPGAELRYEPGLYADDAYHPYEVGSEWPAAAAMGDGAPTTVSVEGLVMTPESSLGSYFAETLQISEEGLMQLSSGSTLTLEQTLVNAGKYIEYGETTLVLGPAALTNTGEIHTVRPVSAAGRVDFGLTEVEMEITTPGTLSQIIVIRRDVSHPHALPGIATGRYWEILPTGDGYAANLTLPAAGMTDPYACRFVEETAPTWATARTSFDADSVTLEGVTAFPSWAVGDAALGEVPVKLGGFLVE